MSFVYLDFWAILFRLLRFEQVVPRDIVALDIAKMTLEGPGANIDGAKPLGNPQKPTRIRQTVNSFAL